MLCMIQCNRDKVTRIRKKMRTILSEIHTTPVSNIMGADIKQAKITQICLQTMCYEHNKKHGGDMGQNFNIQSCKKGKEKTQRSTRRVWQYKIQERRNVFQSYRYLEQNTAFVLCTMCR